MVAYQEKGNKPFQKMAWLRAHAQKGGQQAKLK